MLIKATNIRGYVVRWGSITGVTGTVTGVYIMLRQYKKQFRGRRWGLDRLCYCQSSVSHARKNARTRKHKAVNPITNNSFSYSI